VKLNRSPFAWFVLVLAVLGVFADLPRRVSQLPDGRAGHPGERPVDFWNTF